MLENNGGAGFVGNNCLIIWKAEELLNFNREYEVEKYAPGILLFGSNGGGEAYGFDLLDSKMTILRVPFIGMERKAAIVVAKNFAELFTRLANG